MGYLFIEGLIFINMIITITAKTGKGDKSSKAEIDKSVDTVLMIGELINKKLKGVQEGRCRCYKDGTSLVLKQVIAKKEVDRKA